MTADTSELEESSDQGPATPDPAEEVPPTEPWEAESPLGFLGRAVPLVFAGWGLGRWVGAVAALLGVLSTFRRPVTLVAWGAPLALVVAAMATVIEVPVDDDALRSSFAIDRPTAARAGLVAALWVLVTVITLATRDRPRPARSAVTAASGERAGTDPITRIRTTATEWGPIAALAIAAVITIGLFAPGPPAATEAVAANVRSGLGWGITAEDGSVVIDGREPPLAVVITAIAPSGPALWTGIAGAAAAVGVALSIARRRPGRLGLVGGVAVVIGLLLFRADLAATLVAALVAMTLLLADPKGRTTGAAALAGATFGGAVLAMPLLGLALPFVVAGITIDPRRQSVAVGHGLAATISAVLVVAPWQRWVVERFSTWAPAAELTLPISSALAVLLVVAVTYGAEPLAVRTRSDV